MFKLEYKTKIIDCEMNFKRNGALRKKILTVINVKVVMRRINCAKLLAEVIIMILIKMNFNIYL